jgi:hypothetical protein
VSWAARHVQPRCRHRKQDQNNCRESNSRQPRTLVKFHRDTPKATRDMPQVCSRNL